MQVSEIEVANEEVEQELNDIKQALEKGYISKTNKIVQDLMNVYGHLKLGGKIIDINETFSKVGLDDADNPRLAIVRADAKFCYLYKYNNGGAIFSKNPISEWSPYPKKTEGDIRFSAGTFAWKELEHENRFQKTVAPIIPPRVALAVSTRILPQHYHIIFEVMKWSKYSPRPPRDPILGKMLTDNLFGVLATWDLTDLEAKIIEGRI